MSHQPARWRRFPLDGPSTKRRRATHTTIMPIPKNRPTSVQEPSYRLPSLRPHTLHMAPCLLSPTQTWRMHTWLNSTKEARTNQGSIKEAVMAAAGEGTKDDHVHSLLTNQRGKKLSQVANRGLWSTPSTRDVSFITLSRTQVTGAFRKS